MTLSPQVGDKRRRTPRCTGRLAPPVSFERWANCSRLRSGGRNQWET